MVNDKGSKTLPVNLPKEVKDLYDKGIFAFDRKNYEYAIELFSQAIKLKYDFSEARHYLRFSQQRFLKEKPPKFPFFILNKFQCLVCRLWVFIFYSKGDFKRAIDEYEKILRKEPFNEKILLKLARIFLKLEDINSALRTLEEVVQLNPANVEALKKLGELYIKTDNLSNARSCFSAVLAISPSDLDAEKFLRNLDALGTLKKNFPT